VQIYGAVAADLAAAAKWLEEYLGASSVDINMGCPVNKVVKGGGGSAMLCDVTGTVSLVRTVVRSTNLPVTVKMRLGWDADNLSAPYFARAFEQEGVAGVTVHGRTREQGFGGSVDRAGIRAVVEAVERIPILGNGDVRTLTDAAAMLEETGCAGIAIGRGALLNPWIFQQFDNWLRTGDPGPSAGWHERLAIMETHFGRLVEWRGDWFGCLQFRKVANWYCKALRIPKAVQQRLVQLDSSATFADLVAGLRDAGPPAHWQPPGAADPAIPVPAGPIAHW
jgi:nifR3 family TIM-barrel protein